MLDGVNTLVLVLGARTHCWDYAGEQRNAE